jgi:hypothetical protein
VVNVVNNLWLSVTVIAKYVLLDKTYIPSSYTYLVLAIIYTHKISTLRAPSKIIRKLEKDHFIMNSDTNNSNGGITIVQPYQFFIHAPSKLEFSDGLLVENKKIYTMSSESSPSALPKGCYYVFCYVFLFFLFLCLIMYILFYLQLKPF